MVREKNWFLLLPDCVGGNYFGKCKQTTSIGCGWSSGSQTSLTSCYFLFRSRFYFRFYLNFRRDTYSRPSRARDLVSELSRSDASLWHRIGFQGRWDETQLAG